MQFHCFLLIPLLLGIVVESNDLKSVRNGRDKVRRIKDFKNAPKTLEASILNKEISLHRSPLAPPHILQTNGKENHKVKV